MVWYTLKLKISKSCRSQPPPKKNESYEDTPEDGECIGFKEDILDTAAILRSTIGSLASDIEQALDKTGPAEWSIELNIGFKGKTTPIPVLVRAEGDAAIKITATWKQNKDVK